MNYYFRYLKVNLKLFTRKLLGFLRNRVEFKTFVILSSIVVGLASGLAAVLLKNIVHFIHYESPKFFNQNGISFLLPLTPLLGILLSLSIIKFLFKEKFTVGLTNIIYRIVRKSSAIPKEDMLSHLLTSGVTIGFGGSAGLEAPIVATGAAIGSNTAKGLNFNYQIRTLLLACGSAAGISAIFNSPIAGVIFAFEVLLPQFSITSFIPLLIASASSAVLSKILYSGQLFYLVTTGWLLEAIPYYILLGIISGFVSLYIIKITSISAKYFERFSNKLAKALYSGIILSTLIFFIPPLYGEGYSSVINLLSGNYEKLLQNSFLLIFFDSNTAIIFLALLIVFVKIIATSLTLYSGGNGGIFAPSLFTGAFLGFFLANLLKYLGIADLNHPNFIVVGMAGIMSGVLHAPITGIFLIAEVTGGYILIVPLMIVSALSFFISRYFHPYSIYTDALAKKGIDFRSEKEKFLIQQISLKELIETDFIKLSPNTTVGILTKKIIRTKRNIFPVVDENEKLLGVITLDDVREIILNSEVYNVLLAYEIMNANYPSLEADTDISKLIDIFETQHLWNVAITQNGKYLGFISKSSLLNKYISKFSENNKENL